MAVTPNQVNGSIIGYDPFAPQGAYSQVPGTAAAGGAPVAGSGTATAQPGALDTAVSKSATIYDNRLIPGSGGIGPTPGSSASFALADAGQTPTTGTGGPTDYAKPLQTLSQLQDWLISLSPEQLQQQQEAMIAAGRLNPSHSNFTPGVVNQGDATWNAFNSVWTAAYRTQTDWQAIAQSGMGEQTGNKYWQLYQQQQAKANTPITSTDTSSSTMLTDPTTAQGVLYKAMQSELHRGPTADEIAQFTSMLQSTENANPNVTNSTSTRDPLTGITTRSGSNSKTGIDSYRFPEYAALNYAHTGAAGVEANTTKVATDYMQAAIDATRPAGGADLTATHGGA
jgi:hypothetical protein